MYEFLSLVLIVFGVLQIVLFFKMWGMTNDVSKIKDLLEARLTNAQMTKCINSQTDIQSSKEAEKIVLPNDIKIGDNIIRLSDGKNMIVDSIDDGQYFCKGSSKEFSTITKDAFDIYEKANSID